MFPTRDAPRLGICGERGATASVLSQKDMAPSTSLCMRLLSEPLICGAAVAAVCTEQIRDVFV